jgi:WD40 repeat protein/serine/threonine protein kinase
MPAATVANLIETLTRLGLLEREQLAALPDLQTQFPEARALARELVRRGWLTAYQVNQLAQGHGPKLLLGPYILLERLGEGGMGQVFKARHRLGRIHAVKIIRKERLEKPDAIKRFQREIRAAAQLDHPHIVRAYDADEIDGTHFFSMEYVEGKDLAAVVKERGPLPVAEACDYIRQAALGLQHAHERGLVHRDIKPHNLLLAIVPRPLSIAKSESASGQGQRTMDHGHIKLLDLGLARVASNPDDKSSTMTQEGTVMGTPDYIAPEQAISSHEVDIRADIYSLGCTFYYLLAGRVPFPGGSLTEKLLKHQLETPRPIEALRPEIPAEVAAVLRGMMAKKPQERFQTPAEVVAALDLVADSASSASGTSAARSFPTDLDQALASTPPESRSETMPLVEQLRQKRMAKQKQWERKFFLGLGVAGLVMVVVLMGFLLRHLFGGKEDLGDPDPIAQGSPKKSGDKKPEAKKPLTPEEQEREFQAKRAVEAEAAYAALETKFTGGVNPPARPTFAEFAKEVAAFKAKHGGTPAAIKAAARLMELPSPLDQLDPAKIPEDAKAALRAAGLTPAELPIVGVLGEHRGRHWHSVRSVAFSPNGKTLASGCDDGTVKLWDSATGSELCTLRGHANYNVFSVAFSPDGKTLASGSNDGTVKLWDSATGSELRILKGHTSTIWSVAFSVDGKRLASGSADQTVKLWDPATGSELCTLKGHTNAIFSVAFSSDGKTLASGSWEWSVKLWDTAAGRELRTLTGHNNHVNSVAYSLDGKLLASACAGAIVKLWDPATDTEIRTLKGHAYEVRSVAFSRDGKTLATGSADGTVKLWDPAAGNELRTLKGHADVVYSVAFSPDGKTLASGGNDGTVRHWDVDTGKEVQPLTGPVGAGNSLAWSPDCRQLFSVGSDMVARLWNANSGFEVQQIPLGNRGIPPFVSYSPNGKHLAFGSQTHLTIWDVANKRALHNLMPPGGREGYDAIFSPDGDTLAYACGGLGTFLWNVTSGEQKLHIASPGNGNTSPFLAFNPSGTRLARGHDDNVVRIYDAVRGQEVSQVTGTLGRPIAVSPDGNTLVSGSYTNLSFFDWTTAERRFTVPGSSITYRPDGKAFATTLGNAVVVHNSENGEVFSRFVLPGGVAGVAFANDGRHLATANGNGTVYILRLSPPAHARGSPEEVKRPP